MDCTDCLLDSTIIQINFILDLAIILGLFGVAFFLSVKVLTAQTKRKMNIYLGIYAVVMSILVILWITGMVSIYPNLKAGS